ncbi:MAG: PepSY domain-containing protein, partial [Rubrivivax sp.]|nr:PepSY domain-containing protein [Pyrinomonadaceae bacterium]
MAGTTAGIVILIMSVTGVLLMYERQITAWADTRGIQVAPPAMGTARLPIETLVAKARATRPAATPSALTLRADEALAPATVSFGREGLVFINPYTGEVL